MSSRVDIPWHVEYHVLRVRPNRTKICRRICKQFNVNEENNHVLHLDFFERLAKRRKTVETEMISAFGILTGDFLFESRTIQIFLVTMIT